MLGCLFPLQSVEVQAAVAEVPYLLFCGLNPILYLSMNR